MLNHRRCWNQIVIRPSIIAILMTLWTPPVSFGQFCEQKQKITASDAKENDSSFGTTVAVWGDTALVGAPSHSDSAWVGDGAVYVFVKSGPPGLEVWVEQAILTPADPSTGNFRNFGSSVALFGDTAVIGREGDSDGGLFAGAAYVFVREGNEWTQQAKLTAADPQASAYFGSSAAVTEDTAVIGADAFGINPGSAYVFVRSATAWTQQAKLIASDSAAADRFGESVAIGDGEGESDTVVIGASNNDHAGGIDAGAAYIFQRSGAPGSEVWLEHTKLIASDAAADDLFGKSVALSDDTVLIGSRIDDNERGVDAGSAYVFVRSGPPGSEVWTEQAKLLGSDTSEKDAFGWSIAIDGDRAVVRAHLFNTSEASGALYVFTRSGPPGGEVWAEQIKLTPVDVSPNTNFGHKVSMWGETILTGATHDFPIDSAIIFQCPFPPGCPMDITASDAAANDEFGIAVAIDGDTAVVGARLDDNTDGVDAGSAYVYVRSGEPGNEVWTEQAKLIGANAHVLAGSQTGISVDVSGDTALVGSWLWPNATATGVAYVFVRSGPPGSETWMQQAVLNNPQFGSFQYYGYSVALEGDTALVGSLLATGLNVGGLVTFWIRTGPPGSEIWTGQLKTSSDGVPNDQFGNSVAMSPSQDTAVVGAYMEDNAGGTDAGSAYVFTRTGPPNNSSWIEQAKLTASDGAADDRFGVKVAISGDTAVVGAYQDDDAGSDSGSVYVFTRSGTRWTQQAKLTASDAAAGDSFGVSLALGASGDIAVIGAYGDDNSGGSNAGSAYVFTREGTVWTQQCKLTAPNASAEDWFGSAVAFDGETPVIGARQADNTGGINAGSAYVFECIDIGPTIPACPPDIAPAGPPQGNGVVDVDDLLAVINGWGTCAEAKDCPADISGNGIVDVDDLLAVINAWGPCS